MDDAPALLDPLSTALLEDCAEHKAQAAVELWVMSCFYGRSRVTANIKAPKQQVEHLRRWPIYHPACGTVTSFLPIAYRMPLILPATFSIAPITAENPTPDGLNRHRALKARDNELANRQRELEYFIERANEELAKVKVERAESLCERRELSRGWRTSFSCAKDEEFEVPMSPNSVKQRLTPSPVKRALEQTWNMTRQALMQQAQAQIFLQYGTGTSHTIDATTNTPAPSTPISSPATARAPTSALVRAAFDNASPQKSARRSARGLSEDPAAYTARPKLANAPPPASILPNLTPASASPRTTKRK